MQFAFKLTKLNGFHELQFGVLLSLKSLYKSEVGFRDLLKVLMKLLKFLIEQVSFSNKKVIPFPAQFLTAF